MATVKLNLNWGAHRRGDIIVLPDDEALDLLDGNIASTVGGEDAPLPEADGFDDHDENPPSIEPDPNPDEEENGGIVHTGGGWYDLPDGRRIRGKEAALAANSTCGSG